MQIGDLYASSLKFSLRYLGDSDWHEFSLDSVGYKCYNASNWGGWCNGNDYELRIATKLDDGSVAENVSRLSPGQGYVSAKPGQTMRYTAYDARTMVVIINKSTRKLTFSSGCDGVAAKDLSVAAQPFT